MNKSSFIFHKLLIFLCLIGLLLGSTHFSNKNEKVKIASANTEQSSKKDFKLNPIAFDATVQCLQTQLQQFFYVNFYKPNFLDIRKQTVKIISQNVIDNSKVILFTKIIPSQAP